MLSKKLNTLIGAALITAAQIPMALHAYQLLPGKISYDGASSENGRAVAQTTDWLALGAQGYSVENGIGGDSDYYEGAVFLYKKGEEGIQRTYTLQENSPVSTTNLQVFRSGSLGKRLAMNDTFIVSPWGGVDGQDSSSIVVFEKILQPNQYGLYVPDWPNCPNENCVLDSRDLNNLQLASGVTLLTHPELERFKHVNTNDFSIAVSGQTIVVGVGPYLSDGVVVVFEKEGANWRSQVLSNFALEDGFGRSVAIDGNRLVVGAPHYEANVGNVHVYEKQNGLWQPVGQFIDTSPQYNAYFGEWVDISGNEVMIRNRQSGVESGSVHFVTLPEGDISDSYGEYCRSTSPFVITGNTKGIAIHGNKAVAVGGSGSGTAIFEKTDQWRLAGGYQDGLFPGLYKLWPDYEPASFWAADILGDDVLVGWRNYYSGNTQRAEGAGILSNFNDLRCGNNEILPIGATASTTEHQYLDVGQAIDGNMGTRWSSQFWDPQFITLDLGEDRMIDKVELYWEAAYSSNYTLTVIPEFGEERVIYEQTNGQGGNETIYSSNFEDGNPAYGRYIRLDSTARGTPWGVSLWEFKVFQPDSPHCGASTVQCSSIYLPSADRFRYLTSPQYNKAFTITHGNNDFSMDIWPVLTVDSVQASEPSTARRWVYDEGQAFKFVQSGNHFAIQAKNDTSLCLDAAYDYSKHSSMQSPPVLKACDGSQNQRFSISGNSVSKKYSIYSLGNYNCLDVEYSQTFPEEPKLKMSQQCNQVWSFIEHF